MPVYFIQAGESGPVKIGKAGDPIARLKALQTGSAARLNLLAVIDADEHALHDRFADHRVAGEWFALVPEIAAMIETCRYTPPKRHVHPASDLIDRWGGTTKTAERFNVLPSAVSNWRRTGFPPRLHYRIATEAKAEGILLADEMFITPPFVDAGDGGDDETERGAA